MGGGGENGRRSAELKGRTGRMFQIGGAQIKVGYVVM